MVGLRLDLLPLAREGGVGGSAVAGSWAPGVLVCLRAACCVFAGSMRLTALVISSADVAVVALSVRLCWSGVGAALGSPFHLTAFGSGWSCCLVCLYIRTMVSGCVRGAFGDLGVTCVAWAVVVGGVCRMVSGSVSRVSTVRFCPERCMGVFGDVRTFVVSAWVFSAGLLCLESFP